MLLPTWRTVGMVARLRKRYFLCSFVSLAQICTFGILLQGKSKTQQPFNKVINQSGLCMWLLVIVIVASTLPSAVDGQPAACNTQMMRTVIRACGLTKRAAPVKNPITYMGNMKTWAAREHLMQSYDRINSLYHRSRVKRGLLLAQEWFHRCCQGKCPIQDISKLC